jgi:dTDP-4-dehydrorhamnose reductase
MLTDKKLLNFNLELWGGIECTINRIENTYHDQLQFSRHYTREGDIDKIAELGIKTMRYPILWERHQPGSDEKIDWSWTENQLKKFQQNGITPIAGLVHHGSGPVYTDLLSENFATGLAEYASRVAEKFPWIKYYTPVNEPLTTARFSGLYGLWYPHHTNDISFAKMLINQLKATVLSMQAIRKINPEAKLVQTEDLGKTYSTPYLKFQANFENERRWLTFDMLCGKLTPDYAMWKYFSRLGIPDETLQFFLDNPCPPDIMGFNHYITSERFLDEDIDKYPSHTHGGNELIFYADVEAVRVKHDYPCGLKLLLKEAWERFHLPMAITEAQLNSHREEQLKWLNEIWNICSDLKNDGLNIKAVTVWSLLGAFGWNKLLTSSKMEYEPGVFDIRSGSLRPTALAEMIKLFSSNKSYISPIINERGWWKRDARFHDCKIVNTSTDLCLLNNCTKPILIIGKTGTLGNAFAKVCKERGISYYLLGRENIDITDANNIEKIIEQYEPWALINTAGFVRVDEAENASEICFNANSLGPKLLALACKKYNIQFVTFSSDLVFDGNKKSPYFENDDVNPLNVYGRSKAFAEYEVLNAYPEAMVVRTSSFFSPWDKYNFIHHVIETLSSNNNFIAANDLTISPTYVPDLVNICLDLLIDGEKGIWHLTNKGEITWAQLATIAAEKARLNTDKIISSPSHLLNWAAPRPKYSVLRSMHGNLLPGLNNALNRYFEDRHRINVASEVYN